MLRSHALRRNSGIWAFAAVLIFLGACSGDPNGGSDPAGPALSFSSVAVGRGFVCGLVDDGSVACWGDNYAGQADAPEGEFTEVVAGASHACALEVGGFGGVLGQ